MAEPPSAETSSTTFSQKAGVIGRLGFSLLKLAPGYAFLYLVLTLLSQTVIPLAIPVLLEQMTNSVPAQGTGSGAASTEVKPAPPAARAAVKRSYAGWLGLTLVLIPMGILARRMQAQVDVVMEKKLRLTLFERITSQSPDFFSRYSDGQLTSILSQSAGEAQQSVRALTLDPVLQVIGLAGAAVVIVQTMHGVQRDVLWPVIGGIVALGIASAWIAQVGGKGPVMRNQMDFQRERFETIAAVDSVTKSAEEIQAMNAASLLSGKYSRVLDGFYTVRKQQVMINEGLNAIVGLPNPIVLAALYALVVFRPSHMGAIEPGVFIALALLVPLLMQPFRTIAGISIVASASWPAVELVQGILDAPSPVEDSPNAIEATDPAGVLEFKDVSFTYPGAPSEIFHHLSLAFPVGKVTGLIGPIGQGKSTVFRLALRFYDPQSGEVRYSGSSVKDLRLTSLRQKLVMMSQFPAFFPGSVRDNFLIAVPSATDAEIRAASEATGLWAILERCIGPDVLNAPFQGGRQLSGGQRKIFALTRSLLRNPSVLLLDEPASNLDNDEAYSMIPVVRSAGSGRTVVVIDHNVHWLGKLCDHFIVLKDGHVVEEGSLQEVLALHGVFARLYQEGV